ncbi:MAG: hypothetical protein LRY66_04845, partial [Saccharospirillaceae bacterium]|nr:hypothetical protein [Saccharospirillaceae bacterium]
WLDEAGRAEKRGSEGDTSPCRGPGACPGKAFQIEKQSSTNAAVWSDTMSLQTVGQQWPQYGSFFLNVIVN